MSIQPNARAETLVSVVAVNGRIGPRLQSLIRYGACLGLRVSVVQPGAGSHRTAQDARSGHETTSGMAGHPKRASEAGKCPTDDPSDSPPIDPDWVADFLREQSRRNY